MKKIILSLLFLPGLLIAQNITNTLGTGGVFIVEDVSLNSVLRASRVSGAPLVNIGDWSAGFSLPAGNVNMMYNNSAASTYSANITVGNGSTSGAKPTLNLYYTPGPLSGPTDVLNTNTLGMIGFGGYLNGGWRTNAAKIQVEVDGAPAGSNIPTKLTLATQTSAGVVKNAVLNSEGSLTTEGSLTSKAIVSKAANYTATANDQTIICTAALTITLPAVASNTGKIFNIKKGDSGNFSLTIDGNGAEVIDNATTINFGTNGNYDFVTVQSDGSKWWIIARGN